jgi:hypothetical protein
MKKLFGWLLFVIFVLLYGLCGEMEYQDQLACGQMEVIYAQK